MKNRAAVALGRRGGLAGKGKTSAAKAAAARANGAKGGRPASIIQEEYRDSDGYWIYLKPGWQNGADPGTHGIVEDTKREAHAKLKMVEPCNCAECESRKHAS